MQEILNDYALLGVSDRSDLEAVRKRYKELARKYHPDTAGADALKNAPFSMADINAAFDRIRKSARAGARQSDRTDTARRREDAKARSTQNFWKGFHERHAQRQEKTWGDVEKERREKEALRDREQAQLLMAARAREATELQSNRRSYENLDTLLTSDHRAGAIYKDPSKSLEAITMHTSLREMLLQNEESMGYLRRSDFKTTQDLVRFEREKAFNAAKASGSNPDKGLREMLEDDLKLLQSGALRDTPYLKPFISSLSNLKQVLAVENKEAMRSAKASKELGFDGRLLDVRESLTHLFEKHSNKVGDQNSRWSVVGADGLKSLTKDQLVGDQSVSDRLGMLVDLLGVEAKQALGSDKAIGAYEDYREALRLSRSAHLLKRDIELGSSRGFWVKGYGTADIAEVASHVTSSSASAVQEYRAAESAQQGTLTGRLKAVMTPGRAKDVNELTNRLTKDLWDTDANIPIVDRFKSDKSENLQQLGTRLEHGQRLIEKFKDASDRAAQTSVMSSTSGDRGSERRASEVARTELLDLAGSGVGHTAAGLRVYEAIDRLKLGEKQLLSSSDLKNSADIIKAGMLERGASVEDMLRLQRAESTIKYVGEAEIARWGNEHFGATRVRQNVDEDIKKGEATAYGQGSANKFTLNVDLRDRMTDVLRDTLNSNPRPAIKPRLAELYHELRNLPEGSGGARQVQKIAEASLREGMISDKETADGIAKVLGRANVIQRDDDRDMLKVAVDLNAKQQASGRSVNDLLQESNLKTFEMLSETGAYANAGGRKALEKAIAESATLEQRLKIAKMLHERAELINRDAFINSGATIMYAKESKILEFSARTSDNARRAQQESR